MRSEFCSGPLSGLPIGLRCRYVHELQEFSRYLALQGYHPSFALPVLDRDNAVHIPDFPRHAATQQEFLCVLAECLWGELRSQAEVSPSITSRRYREAKNALAYLNLLLVGLGIFLPSHAQRIGCWVETYPQYAVQLQAALHAKTGQSNNTKFDELEALTHSLRRLSIASKSALVPAPDGFDPMQFWSSLRKTETPAARIDEAHCICDALQAIVSGETFQERPLKSMACAKYIEGLIGVSKHTAVSRIHSYRIENAQASRRDWGHIQFE